MRSRVKAWLIAQAKVVKGTFFMLWGLFAVGFFAGLGFWFALFSLCAWFSPAHAAEVTIPRAAQQYRTELTRSARAVWGLNAPIAEK